MGKLLANDFLRQGAPMKQIGIGVCALLWALPAGTKSMGVHALRGRLEKEVLLYTLAEGVARCAHQGARKPPCPGGTAYERNFILVVIRSTTTLIVGPDPGPIATGLQDLDDGIIREGTSDAPALRRASHVEGSARGIGDATSLTDDGGGNVILELNPPLTMPDAISNATNDNFFMSTSLGSPEPLRSSFGFGILT
jgi:hypothetical protein